MSRVENQLLILGCSARKHPVDGPLPALTRYDGPHYRVLRSFLRKNVWPTNLSLGVLSAEYGLIGGLAPIANYDQRMSRERAIDLLQPNEKVIGNWTSDLSQISLFLGKDYLSALPITSLRSSGIGIYVFEGGIGTKLGKLSSFLRDKTNYISRPPNRDFSRRLAYILPDWDDLLDPGYNFNTDTFSAVKSLRDEVHCSQFMRPKRICDGILVSLAQSVSGKGPLRSLNLTDPGHLKPLGLREHYGLSDDQLLFGDCGAFSYVNEERPTITVEQATSLYDLHGFDFGASVDHMPVRMIVEDGTATQLSNYRRRKRVMITQENADAFLRARDTMKATFEPVGVIQGLNSRNYASQIGDYAAMGYRCIALGGLVPQTNDEIRGIVEAVMEERKNHPSIEHVHLFGIYRPELQPLFKELGVSSFDSATYFRKAWLRSGQNYLGTNGKWYAAIRVPMTRDGRTRNRLLESGIGIAKLEKLEKQALTALSRYDAGYLSINETLEILLDYDRHLDRTSEAKTKVWQAYRKTLEEKPWENCDCPMCVSSGIHVVVFRGANRNKRRGAHNTLMLYQGIPR